MAPPADTDCSQFHALLLPSPAGERADAAAAIANIPHGGNRKAVQDAPVRLEEAANLFGVSERAVSDAKAVAESGDEQPKADVKAGKLSRKKAAGSLLALV
jgi:hypothetical protein